MDNIDHKAAVFTIAVLYAMDEKWKGIGESDSFQHILDNTNWVNIDNAWFVLSKERLLDEFEMDYLMHRGNYFNLVLRYLSDPVDGLVRQDGDDFCYHLDIAEPAVIKYLLEHCGIRIGLVEKAATRLNQLLQQEEDIIKSSTSQG